MTVFLRSVVDGTLFICMQKLMMELFVFAKIGFEQFGKF